MKKTTLKNMVTASAFLFALGHAAIGSADTQGGSLGTLANATDYYVVTCGTGTARLALQIQDTAPSAAPFVTVTALKGGRATTTTDTTESGAQSPWTFLYGNPGNGAYYVLITKTAAGAENYSLTFHCQTSTGVHTATSIATVQSQ